MRFPYRAKKGDGPPFSRECARDHEPGREEYETARAMGQLEQDMYSRQLAENMKELADLQTVDAGRIYKDVEPGGFVRCGDLNFFIAAGLGKHIFEGEQIVFLSPHAPLARTLLLKKAGEEFHFHDKVFRIVELF